MYMTCMSCMCVHVCWPMYLPVRACTCSTCVHVTGSSHRASSTGSQILFILYSHFLFKSKFLYKFILLRVHTHIHTNKSFVCIKLEQSNCSLPSQRCKNICRPRQSIVLPNFLFSVRWEEQLTVPPYDSHPYDS